MNTKIDLTSLPVMSRRMTMELCDIYSYPLNLYFDPYESDFEDEEDKESIKMHTRIYITLHEENPWHRDYINKKLALLAECPLPVLKAFSDKALNDILENLLRPYIDNVKSIEFQLLSEDNYNPYGVMMPLYKFHRVRRKPISSKEILEQLRSKREKTPTVKQRLKSLKEKHEYLYEDIERIRKKAFQIWRIMENFKKMHSIDTQTKSSKERAAIARKKRNDERRIIRKLRMMALQ